MAESSRQRLTSAEHDERRDVAAARRDRVDAALVKLGLDAKHLGTMRPFFDEHGALTQIPMQRTKRLVLLDLLAQRFLPGQLYSERRVNLMLGQFNSDWAALRRYLVDEDFLDRRDGFYWRTGGTFDIGDETKEHKDAADSRTSRRRQTEAVMSPNESASPEEINRWRALPKVELHLHLDTSVSFAVARRLEAGLTHAQYLEEFQAPPRVGSLSEFLRRALRQVGLLQTEEALQLLTADVIGQLAVDGHVYAELRFAPLLHTEGDLTAERVVEIVIDAAARAGAEHSVDIGLILCTLRHFDADQSMTTVRLVELFHQRGVNIAFDLAGDEIAFPIDAHLAAFSYAREQGLPFTVHAGESGGPENVREVLDLLNPTRIGHGVRSIEEPALVERLAEASVHLEICPSCNVQTEIVAAYAEHPIDELVRRGVRLGISTDQRTVTPITLSAEYAKLHTAFGWTMAEFGRRNLDALDASFAPASVKARLRPLIEAAYR